MKISNEMKELYKKVKKYKMKLEISDINYLEEVSNEFTELYSYGYGFIIGINNNDCIKVLFNDATYVDQDKWTNFIENQNNPYIKILYDTLYLACLTKENTLNIIWFNFEKDNMGEPTANEMLKINNIEDIFPCNEYNCYLKTIDGETLTIEDYIKAKRL